MRGHFGSLELADIDLSRIACTNLRRLHAQQLGTGEFLLCDLLLQLTEESGTRGGRFFLYDLQLFLPGRGAGNQGEIILLGDIALCPCRTKARLHVRKRLRFTIELANAVNLAEKGCRQFILTAGKRCGLSVIFPHTLIKLGHAAVSFINGLRNVLPVFGQPFRCSRLSGFHICGSRRASVAHAL